MHFMKQTGTDVGYCSLTVRRQQADFRLCQTEAQEQERVQLRLGGVWQLCCPNCIRSSKGATAFEFRD